MDPANNNPAPDNKPPTPPAPPAPDDNKPQDPPQPPQPQDNPPGNDGNPPPNPPQNPPTPPADNKPPAKPDELDTDILDLAKGDEELDEEKKAADKAAADSYLKEAGFEEGIKAMSLGKGPDGDEMVMPAEDVGAVMAAMRRAGVPADKAKSMLATVGALDMVRAQRQAEQDRATLRAIREETRKEFGDGLRAAARNMQAGGVALFGAELWNDICTIPALVNDKRFVRALSAHGKNLRNDNGGPAPVPATGPTDGNLQFDLKSWMKGTQP